MIRSIEISFAAPVPRCDAFVDSVHALCRTAGSCSLEATSDHRGVALLLVHFTEPVDLPDGLAQALNMTAHLACKSYERANPTRVMWPAGVGFKPCWSRADAAFLGERAAADAPETGEPTFNEEVFSISCEEREDYYGTNPLNPQGERLRADAAARDAQRRANRAAPTDRGYRRGLRDGGAIVFNAVMSHESNQGRGLDLFHALKDVADHALAADIIVRDPDEQPLWQHLIDEAWADFSARTKGDPPYKEAAPSMADAFQLAVRAMLAKKLPAPDSENLQLRQALCDVLKALGNGAYAEPIASLQFLVRGVPEEVRITVERLRAGSAGAKETHRG